MKRNKKKDKTKRTKYYLFDTKIGEYVERMFDSSYDIKHRKNQLEAEPCNNNRYIIQKNQYIDNEWILTTCTN